MLDSPLPRPSVLTFLFEKQMRCNFTITVIENKGPSTYPMDGHPYSMMNEGIAN